ncbi:DUF2075 domain-containing protein [Clostridium perfringens]
MFQFLYLPLRKVFVKKKNSFSICSPDKLPYKLEECLNIEVDDDFVLNWINSKYEPLPTIVDAARAVMKNEPLPYIKKVNSTGIPNAINFLKDVANKAKKNKEHTLVLVTGVPGAGKTFLGLDFVYKVRESNKLNSIYLSGNGPLVKVLQNALGSKVFVRDLHLEIDEFLHKKNSCFDKNIIVFDEGQRIWNEERIYKKYKISNKTEADIMIGMIESSVDWSVLVVLVGEGQEINSGELNGVIQWSKAIDEKWKVICPDKISKYFNSNAIIKDNNRNLLDLTISLRSHLAGDVSKFINFIISGDFEKASALKDNISKQGFRMIISRNLERAKRYCLERYRSDISKRYGILTSSKAKNLNKYVDNSFNATKDVKFGWWYNNPRGKEGSCCNLNEIVTEFGCQGLEIDMPIICWGDDMKLSNKKWIEYNKYKDYEDPVNLYRRNSYRVLLTRGRDGFIIFIPPESKELDSVYNMFKQIGLYELV